MFNMGFPELILILILALIIFGPAKLPEIGKAFGRGLREFKTAVNSDCLKDETGEENAKSAKV